MVFLAGSSFDILQISIFFAFKFFSFTLIFLLIIYFPQANGIWTLQSNIWLCIWILLCTIIRHLYDMNKVSILALASHLLLFAHIERKRLVFEHANGLGSKLLLYVCFLRKITKDGIPLVPQSYILFISFKHYGEPILAYSCSSLIWCQFLPVVFFLGMYSLSHDLLASLKEVVNIQKKL